MSLVGRVAPRAPLSASPARRARSDAPHLQVSELNPKPLPRTSLEPVCEALAGVIRQRRTARGLSLNRLAELTRLSRQMLSYIETRQRSKPLSSWPPR